MDRLWQAQDMVWLLGSLCQLHKIPFDPALVTQQHPPPHTDTTFIEAATSLGFKAGRCDTSRIKPHELTFPCVAFARDAGASATPPPAAKIALIVKTDGERLLYFRANSNSGALQSQRRTVTLAIHNFVKILALRDSLPLQAVRKLVVHCAGVSQPNLIELGQVIEQPLLLLVEGRHDLSCKLKMSKLQDDYPSKSIFQKLQDKATYSDNSARRRPRA